MKNTTSTQIRRRMLPLLLAVMVVLAGCNAGLNSSATTEQRQQNSADKISTSTPTVGSFPQEQENDKIERGEVTYYNASESKIRTINETMANFFENLPENKTERTIVTAEAASESCQYGKVNETLFTSASFAHTRGQQLYQVSQLMRERYNSRINPTRIRRVAQKSRKIGRYTTIVGTYNEYHEAACAFNRSKPETIEDYYLASAALGFELLMFQYGMYYKSAFKLNRALSHRHTYRVIQSTFGDRALGVVMSGSYWLVHGTLHSAPNFVQRKADQMNLTLSSKTTEVSNEKRVARFVGGQIIPQDLSKSAKNCYKRVKNQTEGGNGLLGDAKGIVNNAKQNLLRGEYNVSSVLESANGIEQNNITKDQRNRINNCIRESQAE